jgi:5-hydroxyisourate hydrolase-like protein (transthyretin family)
LELIVQDAAQNTRTIYAGTITTANAPAETSTPAMLAPGPGAAVTAAFASGGPGAPNGTGATQNATIRLGVASSISRPFVHSALKLTGQLLDSQGHPIGNATLDVIQRAADGASAGTISQARTGPDGSFTATVPAGPSRRIVISYRAFTDAGYGAQANIRESVGAGVQLRIAPRRTTPNGTIILTGKVQGSTPPEGALVDLLVHYRRHWEPFRTTRTDRDGRFKVVYQFEGALGRFPFRAEVPQGQASFPYANGYSNVIDVATTG